MTPRESESWHEDVTKWIQKSLPVQALESITKFKIRQRTFQIVIGAMVVATSIGTPFALEPAAFLEGPGWVSALDSVRVQRSGTWRESRFRYARTTCLETDEAGARLTFAFTGTGVALGLGQHAVPAYGRPGLGKLVVTVDDGTPQVVTPHDEAREVVLARGLRPGDHRLVVEHKLEVEQGGCRVSGFRVLAEPVVLSARNELAFR